MCLNLFLSYFIKHHHERFYHFILTVLPKAVITKLKLLKEMHTVTKISEDSETAFYIYFLIYNKSKPPVQPVVCSTPIRGDYWLDP